MSEPHGQYLTIYLDAEEAAALERVATERQELTTEMVRTAVRQVVAADKARNGGYGVLWWNPGQTL